MTIENNLKALHNRIALVCNWNNRSLPTLIAVTKGQSQQSIHQIIACGQSHFGENRVLESQQKWHLLKEKFPAATLHFIGHLQSNKVKEAVAIFDVIHTIDSRRLAEKIAEESEKTGKRLSCFIQVNIGNEAQKQGISLDQTHPFIECFITSSHMNLIGLMCIPPFKRDPHPFFKDMQSMARQYNLPALSMGMSGDFEIALQYGATHLRIGSAIFKNFSLHSKL